MSVFELVVAAILALFGLRSVVVWVGRRFQSTSFRDQALFALFVAGRVGTWFGVAGVFLGYGLANDDTAMRGLVIVPVALAAVSVMCSYALGRSE